MKRPRCENLRQRYKRIEIEKAKLESFKFEGSESQQDVVSGSMSEFPYALTHIKVEGIGNIEYPKKKSEIYAKILKLKQEIVEVEEFIESVEADEAMRNILQCTYILGMSHTQVAEKMGYERSTISKKLKEFWEIHDEK